MKVDFEQAPLGTIVYALENIGWATAFDDLNATSFAGVVVETDDGERCAVSLQGGRFDTYKSYTTIGEAIDAAIANEHRYIEQTNSLIQRLNKFKERVANSPSTSPVPPPFEPKQ